ncbi:c-type cytochrome biogenesis protein CcsB [bacterium]|nr:c-type cytochrome biogenesis protein CcsB [bacterium]
MTELGIVFLRIALLAYVVSTVVYLAYATFLRRKAVGILGYVALILGFAAHTAFQVVRVSEYWHQHQAFILPTASLFEAISYCAWMIALVYLISERFMRTRLFGAPVAGVIALMVGYAMLSGAAMVPRALMPSLKSPWLNIHVTAMMLSYAGLLIGSLIAVFYLFRLRGFRWAERLFGAMTVEEHDMLAYKFVVFAFPILTAGIITGAIWADQAWGRFWGWDPKETWSFITWLIWAGYLHTRLSLGWRGTRSAWFAVAGIIAVFITFFGVNYLADYFNVTSLHSY